ncbi:MFS transporter [Variovorax sp. PAMC 28711]|uniref:MFS transporter n=1 Tax=Variovorax sp. PAMC 28711 TaxID=1795631 RepID=UPI000AADDDE3|nr:MFS transporter [Variovorax sp. PAMC 28711]
MLFAYFMAASAPSPLFIVFQQQWGFSSSLLTVAFAIYAIALLLSLLVAGSLSDHIGRRPVMLVALFMQTLAMLMFLWARGIGGLIAARVVQGIATGLASGALTAAVVEAAPTSQKRLGALISSVSPLAGLAVGALLTGITVKLVGHAVPLVFGTLAAVVVLGAVGVLFVPETAAPRPGAWRSLVPRMAVPVRARGPFLRAAPALVTTWALGGLFLSLVPSLLRDVFGVHDGVVNGSAIATLFGFGALAPMLLSRFGPARAGAFGMTVIVFGIGAMTASFSNASLLLFFIGAAVGGVGFGTAFSAQIQILAPLADSHERAELFASIYVMSYLAFSVPAMAAGLLIAPFGLLQTVRGYALVLLVLGSIGAVLQWFALRNAGRASPAR